MGASDGIGWESVRSTDSRLCPTATVEKVATSRPKDNAKTRFAAVSTAGHENVCIERFLHYSNPASIDGPTMLGITSEYMKNTPGKPPEFVKKMKFKA